MTTFTSSVSGSATGPNGSRSWTISDADYANCIAYLQARYTNDGVVPSKAQALTMYQQETITQLSVQTKQWMDRRDASAIDNPPPIFT